MNLKYLYFDHLIDKLFRIMTNTIFIQSTEMGTYWFSDMLMSDIARSFIMIMVIAAISCFIISELTRNYSQVDKLWSLMPIVYAAVTAVQYPSARVYMMLILVVIWGFRLSYNFYRKGGYSIIPWKGEEDYRWKILQEKPLLKGRLRFAIFNLLFISLYQLFLIMLFSSPLIIAATGTDKGLNYLDYFAGLLMLLFIILESVADNQMYRFQKAKKSLIQNGENDHEAVKRGFITGGLWRFVRHPNFASEQAVWICFYLFSVSSSGEWLNWTIAGPLLLVLLFQGSTYFTEKISSERYPQYERYKKEVPKMLPVLLRFKKRKF